VRIRTDVGEGTDYVAFCMVWVYRSDPRQPNEAIIEHRRAIALAPDTPDPPVDLEQARLQHRGSLRRRHQPGSNAVTSA
jgi:hypothetical protein